MTPAEAQATLKGLKRIIASPEAQALVEIQKKHVSDLRAGIFEDASMSDADIIRRKRMIDGATGVLAALMMSVNECKTIIDRAATSGSAKPEPNSQL